MQINMLIVDDDENFIDTLRDGIRIKDPAAEIAVARSAREALEALSGFVPSVIVLDVQLPDMHGVELLRVLKRTPKLEKTPVVFISAKYTEPADRSEAMLAGAEAFFAKPVSVEELWKEIQYLLGKRK